MKPPGYDLGTGEVRVVSSYEILADTIGVPVCAVLVDEDTLAEIDALGETLSMSDRSEVMQLVLVSGLLLVEERVYRSDLRPHLHAFVDERPGARLGQRTFIVQGRGGDFAARIEALGRALVVDEIIQAGLAARRPAAASTAPALGAAAPPAVVRVVATSPGTADWRAERTDGTHLYEIRLELSARLYGSRYFVLSAAGKLVRDGTFTFDVWDADAVRQVLTDIVRTQVPGAEVTVEPWRSRGT